MKQEESTDHGKFIRICMDLASESLASGDLPFGSVLVQDGVVVAQGLNTGLVDITGHAEINAVKDFLSRKQKKELRECTLYTNFEPCVMCSFIIRDYGIKRVVFSVASPHLGGHTRWNILSAGISEPFTSQGIKDGPEIIGGVLAEEGSVLFDNLSWKMHHFD